MKKTDFQLAKRHTSINCLPLIWNSTTGLTMHTLQNQSSKKILAELVFLYIDSILLRNQDWLIDWVEFNQHCRSWRLRLRATPIWKMLQCTMEPKSFCNRIPHTCKVIRILKKKSERCYDPARCQEHLNFCRFLKLLRKSKQKFKSCWEK